jgi:hypothetical protein
MQTLGISLLTALVVSAVCAGSALAVKNPYNVNTWTQFKYCPYENTELTDCFVGRTQGGKEGGEFRYGKISVKLSQPIVLQGGFKGAGSEIEVFPAANGGETLESPELKVNGGLGVINAKIQAEAGWPAALKESFNAAKKAKETAAFAKIEMAGTECYTVPGCLSTENILAESGTAFRLPLKVKVTSPWLAKLGGGPCQIGNDENPVMQHLTTGDAGAVGEGVFFEEATFTKFAVPDSRLVDLGWHIPKVAGATGCGGSEYEAYVDKALNIALEVENENGEERPKTGITWLKGTLYDGQREAVQERHGKGEV